MTTLTNASEYTTGAELIDSEYISREVYQTMRDGSISLALSRVVDIGSMPTRTVAFPKNNALSASTKATDDVLVANSEFDPTDVTVSVAEYGVSVTITDMLARSSVVDVAAQVAAEIGGALVAQMETTFCALGTGFTGASQNVGSTTANANYDDLLEAIKNLQTNAPGACSVKPAFVFHPQAVYDIRGEGFAALSNQGNQYAEASTIADVYGAAGSVMQQYSGSFAGIPIFAHNLIPTSTSGADRDNFLICEGAIGAAVKWLVELESQRCIASDGANATRWLGTIAYGFGEVEDKRGVLILGDA